VSGENHLPTHEGCGADAAPTRSVRWSEPRPSEPRPRPSSVTSKAASLTTLAAALTVGFVAAVIVIGTRLSGGARGVRVISASVVDSAGSARVRLSGGRAELIVRGFPQPPAGLIYEVWLKRPGRVPAPTRVLFSVTGHGAGDVGVSDPLNGVNEILVTREPDGGSDVPTHPAVIVARLS